MDDTLSAALEQHLGQITEQVAGLFGVSVPWIKKLLRRRRQTGSIAPKPHGGGWTPKFSGAKLEELKKELARRLFSWLFLWLSILLPKQLAA